VFAKLQEKQNIRIKIEVLSMDCSSVKIHPDAAGTHKKNGTQSVGVSRGGRNTKIHFVAAIDRIAAVFQLSGGQCHAAPQGRLLPEDRRPDEPAKRKTICMAMDRGYEDDLTRKAVKRRGFKPVVPPKSTRKKPWKYNKKIYNAATGSSGCK
jgi:hypothetical protein